MGKTFASKVSKKPNYSPSVRMILLTCTDTNEVKTIKSA